MSQVLMIKYLVSNKIKILILQPESPILKIIAGTHPSGGEPNTQTRTDPKESISQLLRDVIIL